MEPHETLAAYPIRRRVLVYGWKRNGIYLYIGQSIVGISRIGSHHVVGVIEPILETDSFDLWYCEKDKLDQLEIQLIDKFKPRYNKTGNSINETSKAFNEKGQQVCPFCKELIEKTRINKIFCSNRCKMNHWLANNPRIDLTPEQNYKKK